MSPVSVKPSVSIGPTTIIGWLTGLVGLLPSLWKSIEEGQVALHGPEKYLAIAGIISLAITNIGRYVQSLKL